MTTLKELVRLVGGWTDREIFSFERYDMPYMQISNTDA
jgi:hypothetical protein